MSLTGKPTRETPSQPVHTSELRKQLLRDRHGAKDSQRGGMTDGANTSHNRKRTQQNPPESP